MYSTDPIPRYGLHRDVCRTSLDVDSIIVEPLAVAQKKHAFSISASLVHQAVGKAIRTTTDN